MVPRFTTRFRRFGPKSSMSPEQSLSRIEKSLSLSGLFTVVERDHIVTPAARPNDPDFTSEWHLSKVQAAAAWGAAGGSTNTGGGTSTPPATTFSNIRVNAGGGAYTDPQGHVWNGDFGYSAGNAYSNGN